MRSAANRPTTLAAAASSATDIVSHHHGPGSQPLVPPTRTDMAVAAAGSEWSVPAAVARPGRSCSFGMGTHRLKASGSRSRGSPRPRIRVYGRLRRSDVDNLVEQVRHLAVRLQLPSAAGRPVFPGLVDVSSGRSEAADGAGRVPERARGSLVEDSAVSHNVARGGSVSTADAGCPSYPSPTASMTP